MDNWQDIITQMKADAKSKSITQEKIAERTGYTQSNISRVFSLRYKPTLETVCLIADAIGMRLTLVEE